MNEEALQQLYTLAQGEGYSKSFDDFKVLMSSNEDALNNMYTVAQGEGYQKSMDDFKVLVGFGGQVEISQEVKDEFAKDPVREAVKKKDVTESVSADGSSVSQISDEQAQFMQNLSGSGFETMSTEEIKQSFTPVTGPTEFDVEENPDRYKVVKVVKATEENPFALGDDIIDLEHENLQVRQENLERYKRKLEQDIEAMVPEKTAPTPQPKIVGYDKLSGQPIYDYSGIAADFAKQAKLVSAEADSKPIRDEIDELNLRILATKIPGMQRQPTFKEVYQKAYDPETNTLDRVKLLEMGSELPMLLDDNKFFLEMISQTKLSTAARDIYNASVENYYKEKLTDAGYINIGGQFLDPKDPLPKGYGFDAAIDSFGSFYNIVSGEEEEAVGRLNNMFNQYGFKFYETGVGDNLKAVGPNGKQLKFFGENYLSLDNWTDATDKKNASELKKVLVNAYEDADFTDEEMIKQALLKPSSTKADVIGVQPSLIAASGSWTKRATGQVEKDAKVLNNLSVLMNSQNILAESAMKKANALKDKEFKDGIWSSYEAQEEYNTLMKEVSDIAQVYESTYNAALKMDKDLKSNVNQIKKYEGDRAMMMANMWDVNNIPALISQSVGEGAAGVVSGFYGLADDAFSNMINLASGYDETSVGYQTDEKRRERKASVSKQLKEAGGSLFTLDMLTDGKTSAETIAGIHDQSFLLGSVLGVAQSLPAIFSGAPVASFAAMHMDGMAREMDNIPEFKNISENEKMLVLAPIATVAGVLENFGLRNALSSSSLTARITIGALKKFGAQTAKEGTKRTFREIVERSVMNKFAKGGILAASSMAAEAETGAAQEMAETYMKEIYDIIKGQDFYKQSIDLSKGDVMNMEFAKEIFKAGASEAIGGLLLGAPAAYSAAVRNNTIPEVSDAAFNLFTMTTTPESVERTLQVQRAVYQAKVGVETNPETGQKYTQKEVDDTLLQYEYLLGQKNEINPNWDASYQKQVLALLMKKKNLEQSIEGLNKDTTKEQQRQIEILKEDIEIISSEANKNYEEVLKKEYEKAKKEGFTGTIEAFKFRQSVEKAAEERSKQAPVKEEVVEEAAVVEEAPIVEEKPTVQQEVLETQAITKITNDLVTKEKKGELTQEETDGILLGIMQKIEAENDKRKTPLSPEQAQKKLGKMQQRVFEANKDRYLELSGVMPAAQEQVVEETTVTEEAAPVVEEAPKRNAKVFDYDNLSEQPLSVLEEKLEEAEIDTQEKDQRRRDRAKSKVRALKAEIKIAKEQLAKEKAPVKKEAPKGKRTRKKPVVKKAPVVKEKVTEQVVEEAPTKKEPSFQEVLDEQWNNELKENKDAQLKAAEKELKKEKGPGRKRMLVGSRKAPVITKKEILQRAKENLNKQLASLQEDVVKKAPVKEEAPASKGVEEEVSKVETLRDRIVVAKRNEIAKLSRSSLTREQRSERKEKLESEIRQAEKKYNNIITELKEGKRTRFRLSDDAKVETEEGFITEDAIVEVMKGLGSAEMEFKIPVGEKQIEVDPIALSKSLKKITDAQAKKLGFKSVADMLKNIEEFNGIPMVVAMSDVLAAGTVKDSMGNDMEVGGGLLYNVLGPNKTLAWAGVNKTGATVQFEEAKAMYRANKELFDRLWKEGKLPKNHVPMVVLRMGGPAINSNEAVFRFLSPKTKSYPKANQKAAFESLMESIEAKKNVSQKSKAGKDTVKSAQELESIIKKNKIKDIGSLFDFIVKDAKKRAKGDAKTTIALNTRALLFDMMVSPEGVGKASKAPVKALIKGTDSKGSEFLSDTILSEIAEPSMMQVESGDAVAIMGVDVSKNGGVTKAKHNNYGFGPKGRLIALIKNPMNGLDIFPEWRAKAARIFKIDKKGEMPTSEKVARQTAGAFFGDKAFRGARVQTQPSDIDIIAAQMRFAFPSVSVSQSQQEFDEVLKQEGIRTAEANGNTILGLTKDGKIFLNPSRKSLSTPIHEFGHIWIDYLRSEESGSKGSKLLERGLELVEGTKALESAIKKYGDNALAREEALVELMGTKGETIANAAKRAKFVEWFNAFFKYIKEKLTRFANIKEKDIKDITLEEFVDIGLAELFSGEAVDAKFKPEEAAESAKARMQKEGVDLDAAMNEAINDMIDKGFKAAEIKGVLLQMGYKARAINDALVVNIDADMKLPNEFANIEGGVKEGEALFRSVMDKLKKFAAPKLVKRSMKEQYNEAKKDGYEGTLKEYTEEQNNKKVEMLKQANPALAVLTNEEILKRYPNIQNEVVEKQQKSRAEIRAKAIELLEAEPAFQAQDNLTKLELINSMDRTMKTRSNKQVQKRINAIKQTLKGVREGVKDLQAAKKRIKNLIREELIPIGVTTAEANRLVRIIEKATKETYESSVAEVMQVVDRQVTRKRKALLKEMLTLAKQKSKGKKGAARTSPEAARFFKESAVILKALSENDTEKLEALEEKLRQQEAKINEILDNINDGVKVTAKEQKLVALAQAFDILGSLNNQDISEVQDALNLMKSELESGMESLRTRRAARKAIYDRIREEANESIREGYGFLFDENGKPLSDAEIDSRRKEIWNEVTGIKSLVKAVGEFYNISFKPKMNFFADYLKHLGTLTNGLDRKGDFFKKNIYDKLNNMEESYLQGYFSTIDLLSSELEAIGIEGGYDGLSRIINDGLIRNENTRIEGIKLDLKGAPKNISLSKAEAMRIYALSKNADQRARLKEQGFTDAKMQQIEEFLGEQLVQAADKVVDILSTSYYESVNKVYEDVNDVSLPFIENYFPTKKAASETTKSELEQLRSDISSGNFAGVFSAQQASALKERTSKDAIDIVGQDFSNVLEEHIRSMERFKAYAMGTKEINIVINHTGSVRALLKATNLKSTISDGIMYAINPNAMQQYFELKNRWFTGLQRRFVGVTLALKFIQLPKQASSFVNAFADYKLRQRNRIPGVDFVLDVLGFTFDTAYTLATFRSSYKEAMKSASFRNRIRESFKTADLLGLEVGVGTRSRMKKTKLGRALRKAKVVANSPTLMGDIAGVMGYMSAYRANLRNGMSEQEALEKFNSYNETQQTRRPTEKVGIQRSNSVFARSFTMFGSTFYLQLNKIMQSVTNISRDGFDALKLAKNKEFKNAYKQAPKTKDYRELVLNLSIANFLFTAIANAFKYNPFMDDDDEITEEDMEIIKKANNKLKRGKEISDEEQELLERYQFQLDKNAVIRSYQESLFGLNQLYNMPIVGPSAKMLIDYSYWKDPNAFSSDRVRQVNPVAELTKDVGRDAVYKDQSIFESVVNPLISFSMGIDVNKPLALLDRVQYLLGDDEMYREGFEEVDDEGERKFKGTFEEYKAKQMEENMYDLMGISYSYRPGSGKDWTKKKITITIDPKTKKEKDKEGGVRKRRTRSRRSKRKRRQR